MRRTGVVLEVGPAFAVVLTRDGEFCRVPAREGLSVGMEVEWEVPVRSDATPSRRWWRSRLSAAGWSRWGAVGLAACVAVGALAFRVMTPTTAQAWAAVSLDGRPHVVFRIDRGLRVMSVNSPDAEGQSLLQHVNVVGQPVTEAVRQLVDASVTEHLLQPGDSLLVAATPLAAGVQVDPLRSQLEEVLQQALRADPVAQLLHPQVFALGLSPQVWAAAEDAHLPPGKLAAYLVARGEGYTGTLNGLNGSVLNQYLNKPEAVRIARTLESADVGQIETLLRSLKTQSAPSGTVTAHAAPNASVNASEGDDMAQVAALPGGQSSGSEGTEKTQGRAAKDGQVGTHNAGHHEKGESGSSHKTRQVSVHIGNAVISVPVDDGIGTTISGTVANTMKGTLTAVNRAASGAGSAAGGAVNATRSVLNAVGHTLDTVTDSLSARSGGHTSTGKRGYEYKQGHEPRIHKNESRTHEDEPRRK